MSVDKFGRIQLALNKSGIVAICRDVKLKARININELQSNVVSLQTHAISVDDRLQEMKTHYERALRLFAEQLYHWIIKVHTTLPPTGLRDNNLSETDQTYIDWEEVGISQ